MRAFVFEDGASLPEVVSQEFLLVYRCSRCRRWHLVGAAVWAPGDLCAAVATIGQLADESEQDRAEILRGGLAMMQAAIEGSGCSDDAGIGGSGQRAQ